MLNVDDDFKRPNDSNRRPLTMQVFETYIFGMFFLPSCKVYTDFENLLHHVIVCKFEHQFHN